MLILTIRTDKPEAELGLYKDGKRLTYLSWEAHRQLAETVHKKIKELLDGQDNYLKDIEGIVIYKGPGSFTGLRIGFSVANTLAGSLGVPIVSESGDDWQEKGANLIIKGTNESVAMPDYGAEPKTTVQKK
jgi:tRNA threonylcarbamoyladenosine biosynthesis protein TsaB